LKEGRELLSNFVNREVPIHEKKDPHRWITRSFELLDLTHVDFGKLETGRKEGKLFFETPKRELSIREELTGTVEPGKLWTFDLRQQGFGSSDLGRKEES
jgi:hypothetical protein